MKKVVGALILAIISVVVCFICLFYIENVSEKALHSVSEVQTAIENKNYEYAKMSAEELENLWNTKSKILSIFVHHEMLENIDESIKSINVIMSDFEENDKTDLKISCQKTQSLLENFKDSEKPTIDNIF